MAVRCFIAVSLGLVIVMLASCLLCVLHESYAESYIIVIFTQTYTLSINVSLLAIREEYINQNTIRQNVTQSNPLPAPPVYLAVIITDHNVIQSCAMSSQASEPRGQFGGAGRYNAESAGAKVSFRPAIICQVQQLITHSFA